ncbi:cell wall-associated hydrolase [Paenibacillus selenitireducens]|jgi:cell wall-associated NlpC family hydrolase|uniref:Cell wall-associated hydrolase n=1 Tax=Paenibacillus selenitireducens TaxID=1324314 RepID=A0A1T2XGP6_9BACL|nr:C40 family peptidase [Paenibacillus selenitireducens]OPA79020.1 cell wall-associated hydrolase [Paenibacillus selenitireducens]
MNPTNTTQAKRLGKTCAAVILSLSVAFSINMATNSTKAHAASALSIAEQVISTGKKYIGVPYKFRAQAGNTSAFDCSSFTEYVFKQQGIELPRSSREQANVGTYVSRNDLQPGDLVFSDTNKDGVINHVSIYMGDGKLLHTYRVGIGVTISDFEGSTWDKTYVTARRVIQGDSTNTNQQ